MPPPRLRPTRLLPTVLLATAPTALVLAALVLGGAIGGGVAVAAALAVAGLNSVLAWISSRELLAVAAYVRDLAAERAAERPAAARSAAVEELLVAIGLMRRSWTNKNAELAALLAATETTIDSLPDPLFFLDRQNRVSGANRAARALFGADLAGRDLAMALRDPSVLDAAGRAVAGGGGEDLEFVLPLPGGARTMQARVQPLPTRAAAGAVAVLALHDMTALRRIERMRADFVANASHELRTPLSALVGFIDTLRGPARDDADARERFLGIMAEQAGRMSRLIADLLSLSRIELNEHTPPMGLVDLARVLRQVAVVLAPQAEARAMRIELDLPEGLPPVAGDADELAQVFQNLIENAVKYGRDGTPVAVTARVTATTAAGGHGAVAVAVRDHGDGIAREHLPRLTERFYRVDTARSRQMGGTGLGLAIAKHILNRHRGSLDIDSQPGRGSVFTVTLPATTPESFAPS